MVRRKMLRLIALLAITVAALGIPRPDRAAALDLNLFETQVLQWASDCRDDIKGRFDSLLATGKLTEAQLFDTFYVPIPNTEPQKYGTQSDKIIDQTVQGILDNYLRKDKRLKFVVLVDQNGYLPTHNSRYTIPLTGNKAIDTLQNRAKRLFNDRTGINAARNTNPYLMQRYSRDTGEMMSDISVPLFINGMHWGAVRIGFM